VDDPLRRPALQYKTQKEKEKHHFPDLVYWTNRVDPSIHDFASIRAHCFFILVLRYTHARTKRQPILISTAPEPTERENISPQELGCEDAWLEDFD